MPSSPPVRLPVPAPWQPAVMLAMTQLAETLGVPREALAPARVQEAAWRNDGTTEEGLEILLMGRGKTYLYRAILSDPVAPRVYAVEV